MYAPMGDAGAIWDTLSSAISLTDVLGVVIVGLLMVLHVIVVRLVVRPLEGPGRDAATRVIRARRPSGSARPPADDRMRVRPGRRTHHVAHGPGPA